MDDRQAVIDKYDKYVNTSFVKGIEPIVFDCADGAMVQDVDGERYVDCFAGISVANVGHRHPRVLSAVSHQLERYIHCGSYVYYSAPFADLAEKLASISPGRLQKTFFGNSGAEAIEGAMRLARANTGRHEFIALQMGFHGRTNATLAVTGNMARKTHGGPYMGGVAFAPAPHPYRCRLCRGSCTGECADVLEDVIRYQTSGDVAAFIAEPVLGEAGIVVPPPQYFRAVKEILDRHGILFIADEVQTGFGRTGRMFAIEHYCVQPDIMTMAKGIAAGFPLGAFIATPEIADSFRPGEHLSTFGGNPVCCAAGIATIDALLDERLPEHAADMGNWFLACVRELADRHESIGDVRGLGLMIGIELVQDRESKVPAASAAAAVRRYCREHGVLVGVGGQDANVVRIQPPLVVTKTQLETTLEVLDGALDSLCHADRNANLAVIAQQVG